MLILELILSFIGGFLSHQSRPYIERFPGAWSRLTAYVVGVVFAFPFVALFHHQLKDLPPGRRFAVSWWLGFVSFALGVFGGWGIESLLSNKESDET